jgi:hypothetical protein
MCVLSDHLDHPVSIQVLVWRTGKIFSLYLTAKGGLVILRLHDIHDIVVVNELAKTLEVAIEVLGSSLAVCSIDIADQDQSAGVKIMRPLSR